METILVVVVVAVIVGKRGLECVVEWIERRR